MDKCNPSGYKCSTLEHHSKERKTMISIPPSYEELRPQFMAFLSSEQNVLHLQTGNNWTTYVKVPCLEHSVAIFKGNGGRHSQFPNLLCPVGEDESLGFKGLYNKETGILFDAFHLFIDFGCEHINIKAIEEDYKKQATAALLDHLLKHEDSFGDGIPDANNADFRARAAYIAGKKEVLFSPPYTSELVSPKYQTLAEFFDDPQAALAFHVAAIAETDKYLLSEELATWKEANRLFKQHQQTPDTWLAAQAKICMALEGCANVRVAIKLKDRHEEFQLPAELLRRADMDTYRASSFKGKEKERFVAAYGDKAKFTLRHIVHIRHGSKYIYRAGEKQGKEISA